MKLKDFTTEQLEFICDNFLTIDSIRKAVKRRKELEHQRKFVEGECFLSITKYAFCTMYKITDVSKNELTYDEIILDATDTCLLSESTLIIDEKFSSMRPIRKEYFDKIWSIFEKCHLDSCTLHTRAYNESVGIIKPVIDNPNV